MMHDTPQDAVIASRMGEVHTPTSNDLASTQR